MIGMEVNEAGFIAPVKEIFFALLCYTISFSMRRTWNPLQVQKLLGHWAWNLVLRRPLFSILETVYSFSSLQPPEKSRAPSSEMRHEWWSLIQLSSFITAQIIQQYGCVVVFSNASKWGEELCMQTL